MLDDRDASTRQVVDHAPRGVGVHEVVVGELLTLKLLEGCQARRVLRACEDRGLVRVLAVAQRDFLGGEPPGDPVQQQARLEGEVARQRLGDRGVVGGGVAERLDGQAPPERFGVRTRPECVEHCVVVVGIHDDRDVAVVLGGGSDKRRAADVDVLDHLVRGHAGSRGGCRERVEVHGHQGDGRDAPVLEDGAVLRIVQVGENPGEDLRVERLDSAPENLRRAGQLADLADLNSCKAQRLCRAAGGDDLEAESGETAGESLKAAFVGHRE